jgi:UDP-N-acetylglucosamine--N-acetylmuramyl-(pentapeptide) pyrophosphoryl-undecaprenol N-acetylglucosamine transferase
MTRSIVIFSGGTGGHVYPGLAVAIQLRSKGIVCHWVGTRHGLEARVVPENGFSFDSIRIKGFRRHGLRRWLIAPFILAGSILSALLILHNKKPDVVLGMGGFVSAPGGIAAWLYRRPLMIHEQNTVPGLANRILAYLSSRNLEAFPNSFPEKFQAIATGNPVRAEIIKAADRKLNKVRNSRCNILIFGGSHGARILNDVVPKALMQVENSNISIIHQCGSHSTEALRSEYKKLGLSNDARVCSFIEDMAEAYSWADLVISRSGAMTLAELATIGLVAVLVPYKYAVDDHQTKNAEYYSTRKAAFTISEDQLTAKGLKNLVEKVLSDNVLYDSVGNTAKTLGHLQATDLVVEHCMEFMNG